MHEVEQSYYTEQPHLICKGINNNDYDIQTTKILKKLLKIDSNCIDVGCHKGSILDEILRFAPEGQHYAFEPLPDLCAYLKRKYA